MYSLGGEVEVSELKIRTLNSNAAIVDYYCKECGFKRGIHVYPHWDHSPEFQLEFCPQCESFRIFLPKVEKLK